ncbi:SDR family NAD(P)-dependent oxidoreductase [Psychroserpens sp.]|uniref:SDR family NAD(P)-dependent oxidoreductase n=1 Tax=Psychroserpens sp. TaxID=2020870 RepID=UPI001B044D52|nr:SDR family NAD(P)-dependent oxidoreductase [Psychroserpens sp.]MBO6607688.1 SDR family NAD(P)-dependent oxidoreductase [Psychroserpens sp.]MBO6630101.1 SDR family NAD(P)-dependent oxidoreductase [Psychroserpens sp.]MBO6654679.1 SDR family NAD(P)-dependent oxidoreductase [Psychroserpens sp.]MBO6682897.1 SDR family NAD(P)-dependent oxidoreductase [Psychroserpens sp.]MBO6751046.1 SDR family NAD(P)-dependent oxidoreductase [Psychroserpens sp.]
MSKTALITGATSGIGRATAFEFAKHGINLILCGRRQERLESVEKALSKLTDVHTLNFDVRDNIATLNAISNVPDAFKQIDILINNAGNAHGLDPIQTGSIDDWDAMMDINVKGLLYVSKAVIPQMTNRKSGHIINIGSSAGKEVYPKGNVYCGSKHAVLAITEGMRIDLNPFGIKVTAINPGLVETEFSKVRFKNDPIADTVYKGYKALQPEDIAEAIYFAVSRPPHVNIADILMFCTAQANSTIVNKTGN